MITAAQADFILEDIKPIVKDISLGDYPPGSIAKMIYFSDLEKFILENAERECAITKGQAQHLLDAIQTNFKWVSEKGCSVTNTRMFIENIIRKMAGVERWVGDDPLA